SSRRRHTRSDRDWSSDVCSSDLQLTPLTERQHSCLRRLGGGASPISGKSQGGRVMVEEFPGLDAVPLAELQRMLLGVSDGLWSCRVDEQGRWQYYFLSPAVERIKIG